MFNPEIVKGDPLYDLIEKLVIEKKPGTILEIGSANGLGSTQAFIEGVKSSGHKCRMACLEARKDRFEELQKNVKNHEWVTCINSSSIPATDYITDEEIEKFINGKGYKFNIKRHSIDTVKQWRRDELEEISRSKISQGGIVIAYSIVGCMFFDMVLIDGSAFTGTQELDRVIGAKIIIMDDTMDIKCYGAMKKLLSDKRYNLIVSEPNYRNGYAAFERMN